MTKATASRPRRAHPADPSKDRKATTASDATPASTAARTSKHTAFPDLTLLPNLANVIRIVEILLTYGRHLVETFDRRAAAPGFHMIARHFGTDRAAVILAHLRRGILRAAALHHVLMQRAARGRDLTRPPDRIRLRLPTRKTPEDPTALATPEDPTAHGATTEAQPPESPAGHKRASRPSWRDTWLDNVENPLDPAHLPTFEELVKQATRRPVGRSLGDIFADLGIAPALSQAKFWNDLFFAILHNGGKPGLYDLHRWRREQHFEKAQDRLPTMDQTWPPPDGGGVRTAAIKVLGFFIGEPPVESLIIMAPEPPPWAKPWSNAPTSESDQSEPPEATGPP